jgi:hypothetical protein
MLYIQVDNSFGKTCPGVVYENVYPPRILQEMLRKSEAFIDIREIRLEGETLNPLRLYFSGQRRQSFGVSTGSGNRTSRFRECQRYVSSDALCSTGNKCRLAGKIEGDFSGTVVLCSLHFVRFLL